MGRKVRKYTNEFRQEAVNLALRSPSVTSAASDLGIPKATLHTWIKNIGKSMPVNNNAVVSLDELITENKKLKKELAISKEREQILKKATEYFIQSNR